MTDQGSLELRAVNLDEVDGVGRLLLDDVRLQLAIPVYHRGGGNGWAAMTHGLC